MIDPRFVWTPGGMQPYELFAMRESEKRALRRQSIRAGLCVIAFLLVSEAAVFVIQHSMLLMTAYMQSAAARGLIDMFYYLLCMLVPFLVAYLSMPQSDRQMMTLFEKPASGGLAAAAIMAGFMICVAANYITNLLLTLLESAGFTIGGGEYAPPSDGVSLAYTLVTIGILTALVEEFALRGVIMQPLRRHGDAFAIVMSAFVFALMHGNFSQITFAFPVGLAIGWFVIETRSIWVGVAIHMLNNVCSVVLTFLAEVRPTAADRFLKLEASIALVFGILSLVIYLKIGRRCRLEKSESLLTTGEKASAYLLTVPMLIAVILLVIATAQLIRFTGT